MLNKTRFTDYHEAYDAALQWARRVGHPAYIRRQREYGKDGYNIGLYSVNDGGNVEVVNPTDPIIQRKP